MIVIGTILIVLGAVLIVGAGILILRFLMSESRNNTSVVTPDGVDWCATAGLASSMPIGGHMAAASSLGAATGYSMAAASEQEGGSATGEH